ncbi:hypothetical protein HPB49_024337 [Dermacentor silvarum]|uniref:Uncharacterized protein n=1 Tax=Dermacentor silvarum TaxID=543639 RepID=A0ACB8CTK6_DERSI|nr:hypothetical protein HPB49_024337 [Dermacentor silvarum]
MLPPSSLVRHFLQIHCTLSRDQTAQEGRLKSARLAPFTYGALRATNDLRAVAHRSIARRVRGLLCKRGAQFDMRRIGGTLNVSGCAHKETTSARAGRARAALSPRPRDDYSAEGGWLESLMPSGPSAGGEPCQVHMTLRRFSVLPGRFAQWIEEGCDSGFGLELAVRLHSRGMRVFAACLLPDSLGANKLRALSVTPSEEGKGSVHVIAPMDVTSDSQVEDAVKQVTKILAGEGRTEKEEDQGAGRPDDDDGGIAEAPQLWALVANAGVIWASELEWGSLEPMRRMLEVNAVGVARTVRAFLPMVRRTEGRTRGHHHQPMGNASSGVFDGSADAWALRNKQQLRDEIHFSMIHVGIDFKPVNAGK